MTPITDSADNSEASISRMETLPLISAQTAIQSRCQKFKSYLSNLACFSFFFLLLWQLIGTVLYFMRAYYCCLKERHATFRCKNFTEIPYSQELELAWLTAQEFSVAILVSALSKVPGFLGYFVILKKSVRLPAFWSLLMLNVIHIIGLSIILYLNFQKVSSMQICLIIVICLYGLALLGMVCVLNLTPVNQVKNSSGMFMFLLYKLTLVVFFVQVFVIFVVGTVQFAFKVTGLDEVGTSADFVTLFRKLREFPQVVFYYKIAAFLWHKLFLDNRNVLSHCQIVKLRNDLLN
ncbi:uncharacterized protein LOC144656926 [Oculina patagonica]